MLIILIKKIICMEKYIYNFFFLNGCIIMKKNCWFIRCVLEFLEMCMLFEMNEKWVLFGR